MLVASVDTGGRRYHGNRSTAGAGREGGGERVNKNVPQVTQWGSGVTSDLI